MSQVTAEAQSRLGWLDALRGIAVLFVLYEHLTSHVLGVLRTYTTPWFDAGRTGVVLFFIISGYIVPAALERRGDLRRFWVNRIVRLYPLVVVGTVATLALAAAGLATLDPVLVGKTPDTVIASVTLLQDPLSLPSTPAVLWSLSYEMIFYLLLSALFVFGLHRRSSTAAIGFAGAAFTLGGVLPLGILPALGIGARGGAILVLVGVVAALAGLMSGRRPYVIGGAVAAGAIALGLLLTSERFPATYTLTIPAAMFAGTVVYRAEHGRLRWRTAGPVLGVVVACTLAAPRELTGTWVGSLALAAAIFTTGMALRHWRIPVPLVRLGLISYSVYVLHYVLLLALDSVLAPFRDDAIAVQLVSAAGFVALVIGVSSLSYVYIEQPMQRLGRMKPRPTAGGAPPNSPQLNEPPWLVQPDQPPATV